MKKEFTFQEVLRLRGCYSEEKVHELLSVDKIYSINELMNLPISIKDKRWFIYNSCGLTKDQKIELCILLGKAVSPIYNKKYPDDNRINDCWNAIDDFISGKIDRQELSKHRASAAATASAAASAAVYAAADAYAAANAIAAAAAAVYAAVYAADAAEAAAAYAYAAAAAADATSDAYADGSYSEKLNKLLIIFCDEQPI